MRNPAVYALRFVTAITIAGCGSAPTSTTPPVTPTTVRVVGSGGPVTNVSVSATDLASATRFEFPVDRVWRTLPEVLDSLAIPVAHLDHNARVIGNMDLKIRGRLGRVPLRRYIDCGSTQGGPNADTYDVWMSITATAAPKAANATEVSVQLQAMARPVTFAGEYFKCATTREFENALFAILSRRLAAARS
jgi:hypothetical protein